MSRSVATAVVTPQDALSVIGRPKMAKVTPDDPAADTHVSSLLLDAAKLAHGKLESAAAEVGKDRSNFTRDVKKWAEVFEGLGPMFLATLGAALVRDFGAALETPEQRGHRLCDDLQAKVNELRQLVTYQSQKVERA